MSGAGKGIRYFLATLVTLFSILLALQIISNLFRPDLSEPPRQYSEEELQEAIEARDVTFDPDNTPSLYVDVDYSAGKDAEWYPKGESPILAELVEEGLLPPLEERVPEDPAVMRGVDGIGEYGGTWIRLATSPNDATIIGYRLSNANLVRWSPLGYPMEPHLARTIDVSDDHRVFTFTLRRGLKWSDGHPFTTDDIMYVWEWELNDPAISAVLDERYTVRGEPCRFEQVDELTFKVIFPHPNGTFLELVADSLGTDLVARPAHYLKQYHPTRGDQELIQRTMESYKSPSPRSLYLHLRNVWNPECPRMWPWVYRRYTANAPYVFHRNPYYHVVDEEGNQLPYIDRVQFEVQEGKKLAQSFTDGLASMQGRHTRYENYTEIMERREQGDYRVLHWYPASRSYYVINPNLNRVVDPTDPNTKYKAELLADKRFRQALSLALNRQEIIKAEYNNQAFPSQVEPGPESPFHSEKLASAFVEYDPERANELLDELGLTGYDSEGFRTFPDGSRMVFYLDCSPFTGVGPAQFIADDWAEVGIRLIHREISRPLFYNRKNAKNFDFNVWSAESDYMPMLSPRYFVPHNTESFYAVGYARWYQWGGLYGDPAAKRGGAVEPPPGHPMRRAMEVYDDAKYALTLEDQVRVFREALDIAAENTWTINLASPPPNIVIVKNNMKNVPDNALRGVILNTPGNAGIETYYFEGANDSPGAKQDVRNAVLEIVPRPGALETGNQTLSTGAIMGAVLKWGIWLSVGLIIILGAVRHPYIARRLLIMVPTLAIISVVVFTIIQLPPDDFLTSRLIQLMESGDEALAKQEIEDLRAQFHFDEPGWKLYLRWMGVYWFVTFDSSDMGLLQGHMGRSMESGQIVNEVVGDRILLTFMISLCTILFTWATAIPIGIYSAVKQYSIQDYILTFVGFIGMCVPGFLLALVLGVVSGVSGLFSAEYATQPEWTWGKVVDLMKHIWIPVIVLGVGGTAGMIRIMRANLLDELKKPYVVTARAKGVRPTKLLFKYPVRLALNPFISGIGGLFPQLVSGGAIVAMVLSLPTVGPLMLSALFAQDIYLAGSMLMVLSILGVFGTLVSDLLLLWVDPRIRFQGGTR